MTEEAKQFLSVTEVAALLGVSHTAVVKMIHQNRLPALRVGKKFFTIAASDAEALKGKAIQVTRYPKAASISPLGGRSKGKGRATPQEVLNYRDNL